MKQLMMICGIFMIVLLAACGDIDEKNSREVKSGSDTATDSRRMQLKRWKKRSKKKKSQ